MDLAAAATPPVRPQLDLSFVHHPVRGTFLDRRVFRWPFTVSRSFHLDRDPAGMLTLILQTMSGAIQAGDVLVQRLSVGEAAAAHVATQGATPVHRAREGEPSAETMTLAVEAGGLLEYLPEPRILFPGASLSQRVELRLAGDGCGIVADGFVRHDPEGRDRGFDRYASEIVVAAADGTPLAQDRIDLAGAPRRAGRRAAYEAHGTLIVGQRTGDPAAAETLARALAAAAAGIDGLYAAASPLPNGAGVALRCAAVDGRRLKQGIRAGWVAARLLRSGRAPALRGRPD